MSFELTREDVAALSRTLSPQALDAIIRTYDLDHLFFQELSLDDADIIVEDCDN